MALSQKGERIKKILASGKVPLNEAEIPALEKTLSDEQLNALEEGLKPKVEAAPAAAVPVVGAVPIVAAVPAKQLTEEEYLATAPESIRTIVNDHKSKAAQRKTELVAAMAKNSPGIFTEAELNAKPNDELEKLVQLASANTGGRAAVDQSGRGTPRAASEADENAAPKPVDLRERLRTARAKQTA